MINVKLMKKLCQMSESQLFNTMLKYLKNNYEKVSFTKDYIIAYGNLPIVLCGHLDTVYLQPPIEIYYDQEQGVMWSPQGIGGDDRCSCYVIIHLIEEGYRPNIILFLHEEDGGGSARQLIRDFPSPPFSNVKCIIELDRQGKNDLVTYSNNNRDFIEYIENFGFKEQYGTFSDISVLMEPYNWCGCNISAAFENEHCGGSEIIHVDWLASTIEKVGKILDSAETMLNYSYIKKKKSKREDFKGSTQRCFFCGRLLGTQYEHITGTDEFGSYDYYIHAFKCCKNNCYY